MLDPTPNVASPRGLAHLLRHRELWPKGFRWNYNNCDDCGMGLLFHALGRPIPADTDACIAEAAKILNLEYLQAWWIFSFIGISGLPDGAVYGRRERGSVTAEMVAQVLEDVSC